MITVHEAKSHILGELDCVFLHPHLDLGLSHAQRISQSGSLRSCQVLGLLKGFLQSENLMSAKCWSGVFLPARHLCQRTTT